MSQRSLPDRLDSLAGRMAHDFEDAKLVRKAAEELRSSREKFTAMVKLATTRKLEVEYYRQRQDALSDLIEVLRLEADDGLPADKAGIVRDFRAVLDSGEIETLVEVGMVH